MKKFDNSTKDKFENGINEISGSAEERSLIKRLFSLKNIIIYVVAFMISMISIERGNFIAPFGIAIVAAAMSNGIPIIFVLIASLLGTTIRFGWGETLSQGIILITFFVTVLFIKPKLDEYDKLKVGKQLIFAIIVQFIIMGIAKGFALEGLYVTVCNIFLAYILYLIFANAIVAIDSLLHKLICTNEEIVSAAALFAIAFQLFSFITLGPIPLSVILDFILLAILAWKNGLYPAFITSLVVSLLICCLTPLSDVLINVLMILSPVVILIGLIRSFKFKGEEVLKVTPLLPERTGVIEDSDAGFVPVNVVIENEQEDPSVIEKKKEKFKKSLSKEVDSIKDNLLYTYVKVGDEKLIDGLFAKLIVNKKLSKEEMTGIFENNNIYLIHTNDEEINKENDKQLEEMLDIINKSFEKTNKKKEEKASEKPVKTKDFTEKEFELITNLSFSGIVVKKAEINQLRSGRKVVKVIINKCGDANGTYCPIKGIAQELYKMFNETFYLQIQKCGIREDRPDCELVFISKDKTSFDISYASQKIYGSTISSEVVETIKLDNGNYVIASSGRDTAGAKAQKMSKRTIKLYEDIISKQAQGNLLFDDYDSEKGNIVLKKTISEFEKYALSDDDINNNLDSLILNMYDCSGRFIKFNATPTYLKRGKKVTIIKPENAISDLSTDNTKFIDVKFKPGDLIVMPNIGVLESNLEYVDITYWVQKLLEDLNTDIPESVANIIMKESIENTQGIVDTNLRVIVLRIN